MKIPRKPLLFSLLYLGIAFSLKAAPLWHLDLDNTFEAATYVVGEVNRSPQALTNAVESNHLRIINNFTVGTHVLTGNAVYFEKTSSGNQEMVLSGTAADYERTTDYQLSFNLLMNTEGASSQPLQVRFASNNSNSNIIILGFLTTGQVFVSSNLSSAAAHNINDAWDPTRINQILLQVDASESTVSLYVNETPVFSLLLDLAVEDTLPLGVNRVRFRNSAADTVYPGGFAISEIITSTELTPIPEPALAGMISILILLWVRMRVLGKRKS